MNPKRPGDPYSLQARLSEGDIPEQHELRGDQLFPLFRQQADFANPVALRWGYPLLLVEKATWARTVRAARQIRDQLCRAWQPETASLLDALRLAYLIELSTTSVIESFDLLWDTVGPGEPREGKEVEDAVDLLVEAQREVGSDLFNQDWLSIAIREPTYEPALVPAAIVASWVTVHRRDLMAIVEDKSAKPIPEVEWDGTDLVCALEDLPFEAVSALESAAS